MKTPTHCDGCGEALPVHPPGYFGGTGYARLRRPRRGDGARVLCYPCSDAQQREDMAQADVFGCYVSSDGTKLTTWPGGELARVTMGRRIKAGFHRFGHASQTAYNATMPDGSEWWGRGAGRGMSLTVRRCQPKSPESMARKRAARTAALDLAQGRAANREACAFRNERQRATAALARTGQPDGTRSPDANDPNGIPTPNEVIDAINAASARHAGKGGDA